MPFTNIVKPAVGDPTEKDTLDAIIDNQVFLNNNIAASVGGMIINWSFETDADSDGEADGWVYTNYTGGSNAIESSNESGGVNSQSFTSTVLANGGGYIDSEDFFEVIGGQFYIAGTNRHGSVADISCQMQVTWYDDTQTSISTTTIFQDADTPTSKTRVTTTVIAPDTARFAKVRLEGGVPAIGTATGVIYFDNAYFAQPSQGWRIKSITEFSSDTNIELNISENNQHLIIFTDCMQSGTSSEIVGQYSQDFGATWLTGPNSISYRYTEIDLTTETHFAGLATTIPLTEAGVLDNTTYGWGGEVRILRPTSGYTLMQWLINTYDRTDYEGSAIYATNTTPMTNVRFDIGTFVTGRCVHLVMD